MAGPSFQVPQQGNRPNDAQKNYKRAYMACIACRKTKAKCEISDDSADCVKCRRERRTCEFTTERSSKKRRKTSHTADADSLDSTSSPSRTVPTISGEPQGITQIQQQDRSLAKVSVPRDASSSEPPRKTSGSTLLHNSGIPRNRVRNSGTAKDTVQHENLDEVLTTVVSSSKDALGLLFRAAEQQDTDATDSDDANVFQPNHDSPVSTMHGGSLTVQVTTASLSTPTKQTLELWSHLRFVRQGWFSAREAVSLIDLFFRNLADLTPLSIAAFASPENHKTLILDEPILCCTLLMISSRYHILPGAGGISRAESIHGRLWKHCEHLIQRVTYGQEKYASAKCRTVGTVKALLLITEWHPRALHFPPLMDGWDSSLAPSLEGFTKDKPLISSDSHSVRWREEVFEPAKRSDRMSWMILGLATTLAHELGVFDSDDLDTRDSVLTMIEKCRVQRLLFLYVNELSLRLGCTSLLWQFNSPPAMPSLLAAGPADKIERDRDTLISMWIEITRLRKTTSEMFFSTKAATRNIIVTGRYVTLLEHFQPLLSAWLENFAKLRNINVSEVAKKTLLMDFSYVRMFIHSLAMQALVERLGNQVKSARDINYDIFRTENQQDYAFVQEVVQASRNVLACAVELDQMGALRYCPVRVFIRITSASVFLLKAISLGSRGNDLQKSLDILDKCINALRASAHDDMHLATRYAVLMKRHMQSFQRNFRVQSGIHSAIRFASPPSHSRDLETDRRGTEQTITNEQTIPGGRPQIDSNNTGAPLQYDQNWQLDDWLTQPFDPTLMAPFGTDIHPSASMGLEIDSLDFLWSLPG